MRVLLRNGPHEVQLLGREEFLRLPDEPALRALLRAFMADPDARASVRQAAAERGLLGREGRAEDLLDVLVSCVARGQAVIVAGPNVYGRTGPDLGVPPTQGEGEMTPRQAEVAAREEGPASVAEEKTWLEIELVDEEGNPVPGEQYAIEIPGGATRVGRLDEQGRARIEGLDPGTCQVSFPNVDARRWTFVKKA